MPSELQPPATNRLVLVNSFTANIHSTDGFFPTSRCWTLEISKALKPEAFTKKSFKSKIFGHKSICSYSSPHLLNDKSVADVATSPPRIKHFHEEVVFMAPVQKPTRNHLRRRKKIRNIFKINSDPFACTN